MKRKVSIIEACMDISLLYHFYYVYFPGVISGSVYIFIKYTEMGWVGKRIICRAGKFQKADNG